MPRLDVPVAGGKLATFELGGRGEQLPVVLAVHGTTANSRAWVPVARALAERGVAARVLAADLRGRGRSNQLPPPYGIAAHAADVLATLDHVGAERAVLVGHSLGAYIIARVAADHPERVAAAVLVNGGLTAPVLLASRDPQAVLDAVLGPALARLRMTFGSRADYHAWWRAHPAFAGDAVDDADLVAYADHDLIGEAPQMRSSVSEQAVRGDGADMFEMGAAAHRLTVPATLLCAPRGLLNEPSPLQPWELVEGWAAEARDTRRAELVPDVNHYTLTLGAPGARAVAGAVAAGLTR